MNFFTVLALAAAQICGVGGQVFLKVAVSPRVPASARHFSIFLTAAVVLLAVRFFVWLGLMIRFDLSYLYPFEAFERILLVLAAAMFLHEKPTMRLWLGVALITTGVGLVSMTDH